MALHIYIRSGVKKQPGTLVVFAQHDGIRVVDQITLHRCLGSPDIQLVEARNFVKGFLRVIGRNKIDLIAHEIWETPEKIQPPDVLATSVPINPDNL